jgi:polysaccharide export outer membrane protein
VLLVGACLGCQSGIYKASSLPEQLQAPPLASARQMDLTLLAQARPNLEQIFAGDVLDVSISTGLERAAPNRWMLRVAEDGTVAVPLVGPVQVAGMALPQAELAIREASVGRGLYRNPQVAVHVEERRSIRVSVAGEVTRPGDYDLPVAHADLLAAISAAGGLKSASAGEIIEISHPVGAFPVHQTGYRDGPPGAPSQRRVTVNLQDVANGSRSDFHLENGSVVMVSKKPPRTFSVIGLVRKPGQYEGLNDQDIHLLDAIAMAGGRTIEIADKVRIYRTIEGQEKPVIIDASVRSAKVGGPGNLRLAPGDVVSVEETPVTFVVGALTSFTRVSLGAAVPLF